MSEREAFGPNLRRLRLQRGVSLKQLADSTKVAESLWAGLERNDFSRWPNGIFARAYVREYAKAIGVDPESTVDDFCRWFPNGDRRVACVNATNSHGISWVADVEDFQTGKPVSDVRVAA